jgi:hypothetical protein
MLLNHCYYIYLFYNKYLIFKFNLHKFINFINALEIYLNPSAVKLFYLFIKYLFFIL